MLSSSFTDKLNLHLIWISQYCSQFEINIQHQSDQLNKVSDALSWLLNWIVKFQLSMQDDTLDEIFIYNIIMIEMSLKFQNKIKKDYTKNKYWKKIIRQLKQIENIRIIKFSYLMNDDLIYYINLIDFHCYFCIFKNLEKEIFQMIHDKYHHADFHWVYDMIVVSLFIWNLFWQLNQYIIHCLQCQHYQIIWH